MAAAARSDSAGPRVLRARVARLRPAQLDRALAAGLAGDASPLLDLNLFGDTTLRAVFERTHSDAFGHRTWVGRVQGDERSTVTLTWRGDTVVGGIQTATALYRVSGTMDAAVIEQVDPASFGEELDPTSGSGRRGGRGAGATCGPSGHRPRRRSGGRARLLHDGGQGGAGRRRRHRGGDRDRRGRHQHGLRAQRYQRPGARWWAPRNSLATPNPRDMSDDLYYIKSSATVSAGRNAVGADLVALVVAESTAVHMWHRVSRAKPVGGVQRDGAQLHRGQLRLRARTGAQLRVVPRARGRRTAVAWKTYGYGYKTGHDFRTVMAYAPGTRILNFSNPDVMYNGRATGTATQNNALSLREAFPIVAGVSHGCRDAAPAAAPAAAATVTGAPQNLTANAVGSTLRLAWSAPATGTPTSYWVRVGTTPGASNVFDGSVGLALSVSGSAPNGTYYVAVYAKNAAGFSVPASASLSMNVTAAVVPGAPLALMGSATGNIVNVGWSPPASGGTVTNYLAQVGTAPGAANVFSGSVGLATAASGGLANGTYYVRLYAQNAAGTSPSSNELMVTVGAPCTMPAAPMLNGSTTGNVISINWTTPVGGPVVSYTVQAGNASGASNVYVGSVGLTNAVSASVGAGPYFIRVVANAACGSSVSSNEVSVTVP